MRKEKPSIADRPMLIVVGIPGGGALTNGTAVVLEFEFLDGKVVPFQFSPALADKLISATQRFIHEAEGMKPEGRTIMSADGAIEASAAEMSFQGAPDGSHARIVIRPDTGPPLSIRVEPEDFQVLRTQIANTERMLSEIRKPKRH